MRTGTTCNRPQPVDVPAQIHGIFLGGDEGRGSRLAAPGLNSRLHVCRAVCMVIAKRARARDTNAGLARVRRKSSADGRCRRTQNTPRCVSGGTMLRDTRHTYWPSRTGIRSERCAIHQNDRAGARQRRQRLAQSSRRQQRIVQIALRDQHDVEVPRQPPMLEAVVEQVRLQAEFLFRESPSGISIFAHDDRAHPSLRAISSGSSPNSCGEPCGINQRARPSSAGHSRATARQTRCPAASAVRPA